jgi:hypothetical protein
VSARVLALAVLTAAAPSVARSQSASPSPAPSVVVLPSKPLPLRFGAHAERTWKQTVIDIRVELHGGKPPVPVRTETESVVKRAVRAEGAGLIVSELAAPEGAAGERTSVAIDAFGRLRGPDGKAMAPRPMQLVLREEPLPGLIAIFGQPSFGKVEWTTAAEPTAELPMKIVTTFSVPTTEVAAGRECVVIDFNAREQAPKKDGSGKLEYWGRGRVLFDPIEGIVVRSEVEERTDDVVLPPPASGLQRVHRELLVRRGLEER